jgi:hypothetical protein
LIDQYLVYDYRLMVMIMKDYTPAISNLCVPPPLSRRQANTCIPSQVASRVESRACQQGLKITHD